MANGGWVTEREVRPGIADVDTAATRDGEEGRLLAAALAAALLEYLRQVRNPDGDTEPAGPTGAWRLLARWEQMTPPIRSVGRGRA